MPAAVLAETSPDIGRLIQPEGYIVGFHQQTQVVIDLLGAHDAEFRGIVPLRQVDAAIGVDVIEVRGPCRTGCGPHGRERPVLLDVAGHPGNCGPVIEVDTDGVAEFVDETQVPDARTKAPCTGQGIAQYGIAADGPGPERPEAGKTAGAFVIVIKGRQPLGTVRRIVVITAAVPGIDAGRAPVQFVFGQQ